MVHDVRTRRVMRDPSSSTRADGRPLAVFFLLIVALSVPLWIVGALTRWELVPGLPVSGVLAAFCPAVAASVLELRARGGRGLVELLKRAFDFGRIRAKGWLVPILLLMPGVMALSYGVMRLLGRPVPPPHVSFLAAPTLFLAFFVGALGEELGWSGYAIEPMQARWGALRASIVLGAFWALWHLAPLAQAGRSPSWIAWWCTATVALRILHTWLFNNTGRSVFGAALFHGSSNLAWQLFPTEGSHYDPGITGPILVVIASLVVAFWGPRTLTRS